jgi:methylenetetrahydrofolate dehydrogenase (NADP+) / methenyltetrahydrofolate cyclohydrolase
MAARIIEGAAIAERLRARIAAAVAALDPAHVRPGLAVVLVGDDPASQVYVRSKTRQTLEAGMRSFDHALPATASEEEVLALVHRLNADREVDGVLVQLPLPPQIHAQRVIDAIDPQKDVDGFHPVNAGFLLQGSPTLVPATPAGIMEILAVHEVVLKGASAVVVGRSNIVGKPIALLLLGEHATVTICHSRTADLAAVTREADVLVAAVGKPDAVTAEMIKPGATVVDVGINRVDGRLVGDVSADAVGVAGLLTPVPGGVGPMTIAALLRNTVKAARYQAGLLAFPGA